MNNIIRLLKKIKNVFNNEKGEGFTLIETLMAIIILTLITGVVFGLIAFLYRTQSFASNQAMAIEEARIGIKTMVREIREARMGDDGSYLIERADDKEFIFFSNIDKDGETERVRYFIGAVSSGSEIQECVTFSDNGSCSVIFSDFFGGTLTSAQISVSVEGDLGWNNKEYAEVYADGLYLNDICRQQCSDCPGVWQGDTVFDITTEASDNYLEVLVDANFRVNDICNWIDPNHSMKVRVELIWEEENPDLAHEFKKGITDPTSHPISYPEENEKISIISSYVRNSLPIFEYYDANGELITEYPVRLSDTKLMKVHLIVNVNPDRAPDDLEIESYVQLRNLK